MRKILIVCAILFFAGGSVYYKLSEESLILYPGRIDYPTGNNPWSVTSGDFNNDNRIDIVTANKENNNITILLGYGDGTFESASGFSVGDDPLVVISAYFNDDNYLDLPTQYLKLLYYLRYICIKNYSDKFLLKTTVKITLHGNYFFKV